MQHAEVTSVQADFYRKDGLEWVVPGNGSRENLPERGGVEAKNLLLTQRSNTKIPPSPQKNKNPNFSSLKFQIKNPFSDKRKKARPQGKPTQRVLYQGRGERQKRAGKVGNRSSIQEKQAAAAFTAKERPGTEPGQG